VRTSHELASVLRVEPLKRDVGAQSYMKKYLQFYSIVIIGVVLFDVVGSFASRIFLFDYTRLFWVSWCIYFIAGYVGCKRLGFIAGVAAGMFAGFADATLGWFLSTAIGAHTFLIASWISEVESSYSSL